MVDFLVSDAASFVTCTTIDLAVGSAQVGHAAFLLDGGRTIR